MGAANEVLGWAYAANWFPTIPNRENCSGFLKSFGEKMNIWVPNGTADDIIQGLEHSREWVPLGSGSIGLGNGERATFSGRLVLVGVTSHDYGSAHGHVAVLLPKLEPVHKVPMIFGGGSPAATSYGQKSLRQVFRPDKLSVLKYFQHFTALLGQYDG